MKLLGPALMCVLVAVRVSPSSADPEDPPEPVDVRRPVVVIDPGHGGADYGARGPGGQMEKRIVLAVARALGDALTEAEFGVVFTRQEDRFVSLAERTEIASRAPGDLFVSIHTNASPDADAVGIETYFLSADATDEEAQRVAQLENSVLTEAPTLPGAESIVGGILGDLLWTAHLERSSQLAAEIQHRLAQLPSPSRGVKQAPFVVLMGVNMPAVLVEIGFLTNADEARRLVTDGYQRAVARYLVEAVRGYHPQTEATP